MERTSHGIWNEFTLFSFDFNRNLQTIHRCLAVISFGCFYIQLIQLRLSLKVKTRKRKTSNSKRGKHDGFPYTFLQFIFPNLCA